MIFTVTLNYNNSRYVSVYILYNFLYFIDVAHVNVFTLVKSGKQHVKVFSFSKVIVHF